MLSPRVYLLLFLGGCVSGQTPVHQWQFTSPNKLPDLAGLYAATVVGEVEFEGKPTALRVSGKANFLKVTDKGTPVSLPVEAITVESWVTIDQPTKYNNIIGYLQDNGKFEKGWLLGGHEKKFQFAIGTDRLTYLKSRTEPELGQWYHVAGTYDGQEMRIYVNGELEATSRQRTGPIQYADSWFRIAGYKDDNEVYPFHGRINQIAIYDRALASEEIRLRFQQTKSGFPRRLKPEEFIALGPYLQFDSPDSATVTAP